MERISDEELDTLICEASKIYEAAESLNFVNRQSKNLLALQELKEHREADSKPLDIKGQLRLVRDKCPRIWERVRSDTACPVFFQLAGGECLAKNCKECWDKALEGDE